MLLSSDLIKTRIFTLNASQQGLKLPIPAVKGFWLPFAVPEEAITYANVI